VLQIIINNVPKQNYSFKFSASSDILIPLNLQTKVWTVTQGPLNLLLTLVHSNS